jgi:hypothetical protein
MLRKSITWQELEARRKATALLNLQQLISKLPKAFSFDLSPQGPAYWADVMKRLENIQLKKRNLPAKRRPSSAHAYNHATRRTLTPEFVATIRPKTAKACSMFLNDAFTWSEFNPRGNYNYWLWISHYLTNELHNYKSYKTHIYTQLELTEGNP